jgi:homoserine O-acetyltransferase/O-succinyltransferase
MTSRRLWFALLLVFAVNSICAEVSAQDMNRKEGDFVVPNFRFQNGEILPELRIHYVTLGIPTRDAAGHVKNAVLLLHGTTVNRNYILSNFSNELFGKDQPLDAGKYYLVIPDAIGHGASSKPSDGLRARFPRYGYSDMVEAQHRLLIDELGVDHLRLVIGVSMGGMHTWLWGEKYPDMMDALMPITSQPTQIAGHNLLWRRVITEAIRNDPEWKGGAYEKQPSRWISVVPLLRMMVGTPARIYAIAPTNAKANELFDNIVDNGRKTYDANDFLYAFESSWDYDPEPGLGKIKAKILALNFSDDMINAVEIGVVERATANIPNARSITIAATDRSFGHLNQVHPEIWKSYLLTLLNSLP